MSMITTLQEKKGLTRLDAYGLASMTMDCRLGEIKEGAKAVAAGGSTYDEPEDFGFMYTHSFVDPDGHGWGLVHMSGTPQE